MLTVIVTLIVFVIVSYISFLVKKHKQLLLKTTACIFHFNFFLYPNY